MPSPSGGQSGSTSGSASSGGSNGQQGGAEESGETAGDGDAQGAGTSAGQAGEQSGTSGSTSGSGTAGTSGESQPTFEETGGASGEEDGESEGESGQAGDASLDELEKVFDEELGTFDGTILKEQENAREASQSGDGQSGDTEDSGDLAGVGEFERFPDSEQQGQEGDGSLDAAGSPKSDSNSNTADAANVPPPDPDDDIVARQLREAAMAESDPEIREALLEEYRRYKEGQ